MSKHIFHAIYTLEDEVKILDKCHRYYNVVFLEIDDLKISTLSRDRLLHQSKIELMKYLYNIIKSKNEIPKSLNKKYIYLENNQFIKEIEIDTDTILEIFDNHIFFSEVSCFSACEGMCKRVLNDIKKVYGEISIDTLKMHYNHDKTELGSRYKNIIELGKLLKLLEEDRLKGENELNSIVDKAIEENRD